MTPATRDDWLPIGGALFLAVAALVFRGLLS